MMVEVVEHGICYVVRVNRGPGLGTYEESTRFRATKLNAEQISAGCFRKAAGPTCYHWLNRAEATVTNNGDHDRA
jgi:hypothetical protein